MCVCVDTVGNHTDEICKTEPRQLGAWVTITCDLRHLVQSTVNTKMLIKAALKHHILDEKATLVSVLLLFLRGQLRNRHIPDSTTLQGLCD